MDVLALGELLIDFSVVPSDEGATSTLRGSAGGAPANVLAAVCRLGGSGQMIAKVGRDPFGDFLTSCIAKAKIDTSAILRDEMRTTLAYVQLDEHGERSFSFDRNPGADTRLRADELESAWFQQTDVFHFGSLSLTHSPAREATYAAIEMAKRAGCVISFDPNLREPLWADLSVAKAQMIQGASHADLIKVSEEELSFLTDEPNLQMAFDVFQAMNPEARIVVTRGRDGAALRLGQNIEMVSSIEVSSVDTTAAGDAFFGGFLYFLTHSHLSIRQALADDQHIRRATRFANVAGALTTTKRGAFDALPTLDAILAYTNA